MNEKERTNSALWFHMKLKGAFFIAADSCD
jgi:hypothetical protein